MKIVELELTEDLGPIWGMEGYKASVRSPATTGNPSVGSIPVDSTRQSSLQHAYTKPFASKSRGSSSQVC